jgi:hypothetical protein
MTYHKPTPGAIIGYHRNGTPIRLIAGGSETATEQPTGDGQPAPEQGQQQPPAPAQSAPASGQAQQDGQAPNGQEPPAPAEADSVDKLPAWAQKLLTDTRKEAAANRARAKEHETELAALKDKSQQQLDGIAKALGLKPEEATPEQIMAERDAERTKAEQASAETRATRVELAVFRAAAAAQADGNALLDSRSFVASLAGLDPSADGFGQQVSEAITAALEAHPQWKLPTAAPAQPAPPVPAAPPSVPKSSPGGGFTGAPNGPRQWTEEDVANASPAETQKAINDGLLENLGFGRARRPRR